jgi:hypothetical protein
LKQRHKKRGKAVIGAVVGVLVLLVLLRFSVQVVSPESPNSWRRAGAVTLAWAGAIVLGAVIGATGSLLIGLFVAFAGPLIVLRYAYEIGWIRAVLIVIVLSVVSTLTSRVLGVDVPVKMGPTASSTSPETSNP